MLWVLAWKNVWRNKKRSLIIILAIIFGLWGGLLSGAIMMGMGESMVNTAIDRYLGHIQIHTPEFSNEQKITQSIPDTSGIIPALKVKDNIGSFSARTRINGMAASPTSTFGIRIIGIDPADETSVTRIPERLIEGRYFQSDRRNPIVVGKKLAERLKLKLHSKIVLSFSDMNGDIAYLACRIVGIFKTASSRFDESTVFLRQSDLNKQLQPQTVIHEIAIRAQSEEDVPALLASLQHQFPKLKIESWKELAPELAFTSDMMTQFTYLFVGIILFALLFGITNTMLMSIMDRIHELGMLISVGMNRIRIFSMILLETIFLSITGGLGGILLGAATIRYFSKTGIDLTIVASGLESFGASAMLYPILPLPMYLGLTAMIILAAAIAAMYPAWKAVRIEPSRAVRMEM